MLSDNVPLTSLGYIEDDLQTFEHYLKATKDDLTSWQMASQKGLSGQWTLFSRQAKTDKHMTVRQLDIFRFPAVDDWHSELL